MEEIPVCMICHNPTLIQQTKGVWVSNGISVCCEGANCHEACLTKYYQTSGIKCLLCRKDYPKLTVYTSPKLQFGQNNTVDCLVPGITNSCSEEPVWSITNTTNEDGITYINNDLAVDNSFQSIRESDVMIAKININETNEMALCEMGIAISHGLRIYLVFEPEIKISEIDCSVRQRLWYPIEASLTSIESLSTRCLKCDFWFINLLRDTYQTVCEYKSFLFGLHPKIPVPVPTITINLEDLVDPVLDSDIVSPTEHMIFPSVITQPTISTRPPPIPISLPPRSNLPTIIETTSTTNQHIIGSDPDIYLTPTSPLPDSPTSSGTAPPTLPDPDSSTVASYYNPDRYTTNLNYQNITSESITNSINELSTLNSSELTHRFIRGHDYFLDSNNAVYLNRTSTHSIGIYNPIQDIVNFDGTTPSNILREV